jgi:hypothetical protein
MISSPSSLELLEEPNSMIYPSLVQAVTTDKTISNITRGPGYLLHGLGAAANQVRWQ